MKYLFVAVVIVVCTSFPKCTLAQYQNKWVKEMNDFDRLDSLRPPSTEGLILFTGSSSIRFWKDLKSDFGSTKIINRGFGGSQIEDLIENFDRVICKYNPEMIVIYSGDNDIAFGKSPEIVFGDFCALYGMIKSKLPRTKVVFISIKPSLARWNLSIEITKANTMIKEYLQSRPNTWFVDIYSSMIDENGTLGKKFFVDDGLHMTTEGYALWTRILKPVLAD